MQEIIAKFRNLNCSKKFIVSLIATVMLISCASVSTEIKAQFANNNTNTIPQTGELLNNNTNTIPQTGGLLNNNPNTIPQTGGLLNNNPNTIPQTGGLLNNNPNTNSLQNLNGSLNVLPIVSKALISQLNQTMNQATLIALNEVGKRSTALTNTLDIVKGFLAYKVIVFDVNGNLHEVIVDSGNGKVLYSGTNIIDKNLVPTFLSSNQLMNTNIP